MLQRGSLIRVWVALHPRRTARKVPSLGVWVGSHPRRTETLWFIYIKVHKHKETKFSEHMVCCFVDKVMKFGEGSVQTARVTGQKVGVWVVLHPRRTGKVKCFLTSHNRVKVIFYYQRCAIIYIIISNKTKGYKV